ncbi:hypothetical protein WJX73_003235 [Symbiochloris irregularis]|uniref:Uncharacterized protein n=1 Tax=Symbiochloris irregularis TaxID=706552 RepID=A0AAW1PNE4_9CHLO
MLRPADSEHNCGDIEPANVINLGNKIPCLQRLQQRGAPPAQRKWQFWRLETRLKLPDLSLPGLKALSTDAVSVKPAEQHGAQVLIAAPAVQA